MTEETQRIDQQKIYKLTPESASDKKRKIKTGIAVNYFAGFLVFSFSLINGYKQLDPLVRFGFILALPAFLGYGYWFFSKKHSKKIDESALTVTEHSISVTGIEQKLSLKEIVKVDENSKGITLQSRYDFKKKLFIDSGFEDFDAVKAMLTETAQQNTAN
ncbi:hypothetical protein D0C36_11140 [Mucilaginibacter conchicola]|uniref:Uncharacterized protein n=1 Tax=Mucilaginibacter conchicola TaxID=2303333 RepID=A0A372NRX1_9SPHI|nr:hypothetical protein [Mucilaginibacter conchicola]RFZ91995.1 hypothetical protein D0C36_11140 [Mucilaginibacter conchicola]